MPLVVPHSEGHGLPQRLQHLLRSRVEILKETVTCGMQNLREKTKSLLGSLRVTLQPPSDPLLSVPTQAHQLDLTPGPQRGVSFDARLEKPPKYGGKRDRDACKVWLNRMRMHPISE
jgi:hypothetical protein